MPDRDCALLLGALAGLVPDQAPSDEARLRMRAALLARLPARAPGTHVLRHAEGEWKQLMPGVRVKTLRRDPFAGTETTLWRVDPGASVPPHAHRHEEECLVLEGSIVKDDVEYFPGDFLLADAGELHSRFSSPRGALFLIRGEILAEPASSPPSPA